MNKMIALTKLQMKDFFSKYQSGMNIKSSMIRKLLLLGVMVALFIPSVQLSIHLFEVFSMAGAAELVITYMYCGTALVMMVGAIPFIVSIFFYAKDLKFLASLPIREEIIVFSKLSTVYLYLLGMSGFFLGPAIIIYGIKGGTAFTYFFFALLTFLVSPILPLVLSTLVILPFMKFISNRNRRNLLSIVGGFLLVAIIVVVQLLLARLQGDTDFVGDMLLKKDGLLNIVGVVFPPSIWLTRMLRGSLLNTLYFILLNIALMLVLFGLSKQLYLKAMMAFNQESIGTRSGIVTYSMRNKKNQLIKRHILIIFSNPTFFLNTFISIFVPIVLFVVYFFTGELSANTFQLPELQPYILMIYASVITSPAVISSLSATVITREGKAFWETRVMPISTTDNISSRIHSTILLNLFGSFILGILALFLLPVTFKILVPAILVCITATLFFSTIDIIINILRPLLNWTNPTAAVKNNMNILFSLGIRAVSGLIFFMLYAFVESLKIIEFVYLLSIIFLVLYGIARYLVFKVFVKKFEEIVD